MGNKFHNSHKNKKFKEKARICKKVIDLKVVKIKLKVDLLKVNHIDRIGQIFV